MKKKTPQLLYTPYAWSKLLFLRDQDDAEVGGFGLLSVAGPVFLVSDILVPRQTVGYAHVSFDDDGVADLVDDMVDRGYQPKDFGRVWIHTHPGTSATPSGQDEATFDARFGKCHWSIMAIVAKGGQAYARLRYAAPDLPPSAIEIPVGVDWTAEFPASEFEVWSKEYEERVQVAKEDPHMAKGFPSCFSPMGRDPMVWDEPDLLPEDDGLDGSWEWEEEDDDGSLAGEDVNPDGTLSGGNPYKELLTDDDD